MPRNRFRQHTGIFLRFDRKILNFGVLTIVAILAIISLFTIIDPHNDSGKLKVFKPMNERDVCGNNSLQVGIKIKALDQRFLSLGGTRHWFHLLERLTSQIESFKLLHEKILQMKRRNGTTLYVAFNRKSDVENLGSFGRLLFSSLAGGSKTSRPNIFETIVFGYSLSTRMIRIEKNGDGMDLYSIEEHNFQSQFVVDLKSQKPEDLFVVNSDSIKRYSHLKPICLQILSEISLDRTSSKLEWFEDSLDRFDVFRSWIFDTCNSRVDDTNKENKKIKDNNEVKLVESKIFFINEWIQKKHQNRTEISRKGLKNKKETSDEELLYKNNRNQSNYMRRNFLTNNSMLISLQVPSQKSVILSDDLNVGQGEMQRKIKKAFWKKKIKDIELKSSPIVFYSPFIHNTSNISLLFPMLDSNSTSLSSSLSSSSFPSNSSYTVIDLLTSPLKVLIYQRDFSRKIINIKEMKSVIQSYLGSKWVVDVITHTETISPCTIIQNVRTATVLITPHGFQSILLLFQPYSSLLIEIHPAYYLKQEVYGFIQAGLRQNFDLARSYLAEESEPTKYFYKKIKKILENHNFFTHDCLHNRLCRYLARKQDVQISTNFIKRSTDFILSHFIL